MADAAFRELFHGRGDAIRYRHDGSAGHDVVD